MAQQGKHPAQKEIDPQTIQAAKKGPIQQRQCRDSLCFLLFIANIGGMVYCAIYGYINGDINNIFRGTDSTHSICNNAQFPLMYFSAPLGTNALKNRICVKSCPTKDNSVIQLNCEINANTPNCTVGFNLTQFNGSDTSWISSLPDTNPSASYIIQYDSLSVLDRVCVPSTSTFSLFTTSINSTFGTTITTVASGSSNYLSSAVDDFTTSWPIILAAVGVCIIFSLMYLCLLKCCAGVMVWCSLFGAVIAVAGLGAVFFIWSGQLQSFSTGVSILDTNLKNIQQSQETYQTYKYFAYALWGVAGLALILILCMCSQISLAIAVAKAAGSFINSTLSVMIVPFTNTLAALLIWAIGITGTIWLLGAAQWVVASDTDYFTSLKSFQDEALYRLYYFFFGVLWCDALVSAYSFFIIASATALWYYSHGQQAVTNTPILTSIWRGLRYHFGSLVFGALLVAIIQSIRIVYEFIARQIQQQNPDNKLIQCLLCVGRSCLSCLQCIIQFINRNAYITIAITGKNFCYAAKEGFEIVWSNPLRFGALAGVGRALSFVGNILIVSITTITFYLIIQYTSYKDQIVNPYLVTLFVGLIALLISMVFVYVFTAAMDTIIVCFILDQQVHKALGKTGSINAPPQIAELF